MLPSGGRRLGGGESAIQKEAQFTPQELAAQAAERRRLDNQWCGGQEALAQEPKPEDYVTRQDIAYTKRAPEEDGWTCEHCTFINEPLHLACSMCSQEKSDNKKARLDWAFIGWNF